MSVTDGVHYAIYRLIAIIFFGKLLIWIFTPASI